MPKRLLFSIGLLSVALIAFQLVLMQILSYSQWYHFAYMIISVAMLGFGFSGTVLAISRRWFLDRSELLLPVLMLCCGTTMAAAVFAAGTAAGGFDMYLLFVDSSQLRLLATTYLMYMIPFFFGALAIGLSFVRYTETIGKVYFSNLAGSGIGGVAAVAGLWILHPQELPGVLALIAIAAGALLITKKYRIVLLPAVLVAVMVSGYAVLYPPSAGISEYKSVSRTLNLPGAEIEYERSSPFGFVQVVSTDALRHAPGLSLAYRGEIPVRKAVFNNGDWFGPLASWSRSDSVHLMDYTTKALPYITGTRKRVLVLQAGTGMDVSQAVTRGARKTIAVEPNVPVTELLLDVYAPEIDSLFMLDSVELLAVEPRTYLKTTGAVYDLIVLPTIETFGGSAGLYAMQEQYLLTQEAFSEMWRSLTGNGAIAVTSWMDYPVKNPLKTLSTLVGLLASEGVTDPTEHLIAVRSWGTVTFTVHRTPVDEKAVSAVRTFCRSMFFDPLLLPGLEPEERNRYNDIGDLNFFGYVDELVATDGAVLFVEYGFNIRPATDNRPYFSQFLRWESLAHVRRQFGDRVLPFIEVGYLVVAVTFLQICFAAVALIVAPLFRIGFKGKGRGWTIFYFGGLGLGFMFFEIVLIQRFILYLGQPVYSVAAVITSLLLCSGAGSIVSSRLRATGRNLRNATGLIAGIILVYILLLPFILELTIGYSFGIRAVMAFLIIGLPACFMGIPFPLGVRYVSALNRELVPWSWGINGCMSVVSTVLATVIAVEFGFIAVMLFASGAYLIASGSNWGR